MKILHLMAGAEIGGAERFFGRLAMALHGARVTQDFVIRPDHGREAMLKEASLDFATAPFGGLFDLSTRSSIRNRIHGFQPDIVLSWMNRATRHCPPAGKAVPFRHIGTPRGYYDPKYYRRCDHLIVTTDDLKRFYADAGFDPGRISVIQNFVAESRSAPVPRAQFDTPEGAPLLLALGRLHMNKGFDTLIGAMKALPDHFLWIGGDGPLQPELEALSIDHGVSDRVRFLGWRRDTAALYAAADIFVCSSRHEPFGNIIIEAWMQNVPIVAAASEGPSQILSDGETGLLTAIDDDAALAAAILRLGDQDIARRLATSGRREYEARYSDKAVIPLYLDVFDRVAG